MVLRYQCLLTQKKRSDTFTSQRHSGKPNRLWIHSMFIAVQLRQSADNRLNSWVLCFFKAHQVLVWLGEDDGTT